MNKWEIGKGVLTGFGVYVLFMVSATILLLMFDIVAAMSPGCSIEKLESFQSHSVLWRSLTLNALLLVSAGYIASASVASRKLIVALLLGVLLAAASALPAPAIHKLELAITSGSGGLYLFEHYPPSYLIASWVSVLAFPIVGAYAESRRCSRKGPLPVKKTLRRFTAQVALFIGLFTLATCILLLLLCPVRPDVLGEAVVYAGVIIGVILLGYSSLTFHQIVGMKKAMLRSPFSLLTYVVILYYAFAFVHADSTHRPDPSHLARVANRVNGIYQVSEEGNGASLYIKAIELLSKDSGPNGSYKDALGDAKKVHEWNEWLGRNKESIAIAIAAGKRPFTYFPVRPDKDGLDWRFEPPLSSARWLCRVLSAKAQADISAGNLAEALLSLDAGFKLGTALSKGPVMSLIVGCTCRQMALRVVADTVRGPGLNADELNAIGEALNQWSSLEFPAKESWPIYAELESAWMGEAFSAEMRNEDVDAYFASLQISKGFMADVVRYPWNEVLLAPSLREKAQRASDFQETFLAKQARTQKVTYFMRLKVNLGNMQAANIATVVKTLLEHQARIALLKAYVGADLFLMAQGRIPRSWSDLVPAHLAEVPMDPFLDQPLKLIEREGSAVIYSVEREGKDHGGVGHFYEYEAKRSPGEKTQEDICLVLPAAVTKAR